MSDLDEARKRRKPRQEPLTEGPWQATEEIGGDNFRHSIYGPAGDWDALLIARCNQNGAHNADARILAAAPELYEALKAFAAEPLSNEPGHSRTRLFSFEDLDEKIRRARAALAKVDGEK